MDLGPDQVKQTARDMGIRSKLNGYPAETLGGLENGVSPLEMATAYATLASGGYRNRPTAIKRIVFPDGHAEQGKSLPKRFRVKRTKVFTDGVAAKATEILQQNMIGGTGTRAQIGCPAAGKTGTTDNNTDAWFVGFTPRLSTAVWVGYPDSRIYMNSLFFGGPIDGGTYPAIIWGQYMQNAVRGRCDPFPLPHGAVRLHPVLRPLRQLGRRRDRRPRRPSRPSPPRRRPRTEPTDAGGATDGGDGRRRPRPPRRSPPPSPMRPNPAASTRRSTRPRPPTARAEAGPARMARWYKPARRAAQAVEEHAGRQCPAAPPRASEQQ